MRIAASYLSLVIALSSVCAHAADLTGGWSGMWVKDRDPLPVTVTIAKNSTGYSGSLDSDALQASGIQFGDVTEDGDMRAFPG